MRRIISRTRSRIPETQFNSTTNDTYPSGTNPDTLQNTTTPKKVSPVLMVTILVVIAIIIGGAIWFGSKIDDQARAKGPEAVVEQVLFNIGKNQESSAKKYIQSSDTVLLNDLSVLFDTYARYFSNGRDYIKWTGLAYSLSNISESEAQVGVSGTAEIIEVTISTYEDSDGYETEQKTETSVEQISFSGAVFELKKIGEEWFLSNLPVKIF